MVSVSGWIVDIRLDVEQVVAIVEDTGQGSILSINILNFQNI